MKKTMKKVLVMTLVLALCMTMFAGCGEEATEFFIGASGPLTGPAASYGISVRNGAQIAVDEINEAGGINGVQIKFVMEDDEHDTQRTNTVVNGLIDDGMQVFMGTVTSGPCIESGELTMEANIFQITPSGSATECAQYDNQFRVCFNDPLQGVLGAGFIADNYADVKNVGVLYDSSDVYSSGIYKAFMEEIASDITVTTESFTADTNTDFSSQIASFKAAGCEFVFCPFYAEQAVAFLTQCGEKSFAPTFMGCDGLDGIIGLAASKEIVEGVIYLTPFIADATDDATVAFVSEYKSLHSATPDQFAADGYDSIYAIKAAIEKAGVSDPTIDPSELCELMKKSITEVTVDGLTGSMVWDASGEATKAGKYVVIENGTAVAFN